MEDISKIERMRKFILEGKTNSGCKIIFEGLAIGDKFIHRMDKLEFSAFLLRIKESKGEPDILDFRFLITSRNNR